MSQADGLISTRQMMVVLSTAEEWLSLKSLLQDGPEDRHLQFTFSSLGSTQICDLTTHDYSVSLRHPDLNPDMTEEATEKALDGCYRSCAAGVSTFLLLIQGGHYTKREMRMVEILGGHFGAEALKYLSVLSLEDGQVAETLDDALLDLINVCDGKYCRVTSSATGDKLHGLLDMVDRMLSENGVTGYTETMLSEARDRNTEDSAMKMLRLKVREAEEKEQGYRQTAQQREEKRAGEMEELRRRHAEERQREAGEQRQYETKRESLEEAVMSHRAMVQLQTTASSADDDSKKTSIIVLGLSGSGKTSAVNLILQRAGNQYSVNDCTNQPPQSTLYCAKKEVSASGRPLVFVDTPELWDEDGAEDPEHVKDCLALALPGPHVYLLVLQVGRFTQGECELLGELQKMFGREFTEHAVVLFVRIDGDQRGPQKIDEYVSGAHPTLRELVRKCGSRYYELSVVAEKSQNALSYPQVKELMAGIGKLVASHGGKAHSVRRFSEQELQQRRKDLEEGRDEAIEGNYLLRDN